MSEKLNTLQKKINIKFKSINYLKKAITHKSYDSLNNYEKLEFLGDRVLGLVISKKLIELYPNEKEGVLDKKLASLVNKNQCLEVAKYIGLEKFILNMWKNFIKLSEETRIDSKTKLQEYSLKKFKKLPIYKSFKHTGPNHNPIFKVQVSISNSTKYFGKGKSKKLAEQNAASKLVKSLKI